ncbi:DUF2637 domain-containing protein [Streptomyces sp. NPDC020965]|uniref:DUF2637 domain-containing protein n=1 Tax=Streptomyces sp. NPDC020965 TaxID=3365105 RepID=UPI003791CE21
MAPDRLTARTVTVVMVVIATLAFVFSFGNVWALALRLGVPDSIAPLIAPMVDLSVIGLLVALRHLSLRGLPARELRSANRLMHLSGLLTLALNIAEPLLAGHYGRAALDAVAPVLLLGWGHVGPELLRHLHSEHTPPAETPAAKHPATRQAPAPPVPAPLLDAARRIADEHRLQHGTAITPAQLKARLGVALPLATAAHSRLSD